MSKEKIEQAVGRAAKTMTEVVTAVEKFGHALTPAQLDKALAFLRLTLDGVEQRARIARNTAIATSGTFSLDMELPGIQTPSPAPAPINHDPRPTTADPARRRRPEGRLVGKQGVYYAEEPAPPKTRSELEVEPGEIPDPKTDYIEAGFISD